MTPDEFPSLTNRECQTLYWVCHNLTRNEIAQEMGIAPDSVRNYINRIYSKFGWSDENVEVKRAMLLYEICPIVDTRVDDPEDDCPRFAAATTLGEVETEPEPDPEIRPIVKREIDELLPLKPAPLDIVRPTWTLFPPVPLWRRVLTWLAIIGLSAALFYVVFLQADEVQPPSIVTREVIVTILDPKNWTTG